ncbi:MAG: Flp1 family type IVb pilin [Bacillota bacterium]|nr:Flp1 family type IVb pilin [Bacillota bacterium]
MGFKLGNKSGMELVQVAILVAIAVALGLIFKTQITDFVTRTFEGLNNFS